ncbi:MAG: type II secretion system protein [Planctomycetota bacterium]
MGFTMVEFLVASAIALIILTVGFVTINGTIKATREATAMLRATENSRLFFQTLERDLAAAWPGPFDMVKGMDTTNITGGTQDGGSKWVNSGGQLSANWDWTYSGGSLAAGYQYGTANYSSKAQLEPVVLQLSGNIITDALQFYTRADIHTHPDQTGATSRPERRVLVRYYLNPSQHTLCRQVLEDDAPTPVQLEGSSLWPRAMTDLTWPDENALCEDVRTLRFLLRRWDANYKEFVPPLNSILPYTPATDNNPVTNNQDYTQCTHLLVRLELRDRYTDKRATATGNYAVIPCRVFTKVLPLPKALQ